MCSDGLWREAVCAVMKCGASAAVLVCERMRVCELMSNVLR